MRAVLVDGLNLAFRAHHGHKFLSSKDGRPTGVIYSVLRLTIDLHKRMPDARLIFFWEGGLGKHPGIVPWRREIKGGRDYKATRQANEDTPIVLHQVDTCMKILSVLGYGQYYVPGLEADDLIGIVATFLQADMDAWRGEHIYLLTNDRDYFQLVTPSTTVLRKEGDKLATITPKRILTDYSVSPADWVRYRALVGDVSDNIKGLQGCGPKTAPKLLAAGIDPSLRKFSDHPTRVCKQYSHIEQHWADVHASYLLSYIPRSAGYKLFPEEARAVLRKEVPACYKRLKRRMTEAEAEHAYRQFTSFCGDYNLDTFMADRRSFFSTVKISRS